MRTLRSTLPLAAAALLGCDGAESPLAAVAARPAAAGVLAQESSSDVSVLGTIPLPVDQSVASASVAFGITQTGSGTDAQFLIGSASNVNPALYAVTVGTGPAAFVQTTHTSSVSPALRARTGGLGRAGEFIVNNALNLAAALSASTDGRGPAGTFTGSNANSAQAALRATTSGTGAAVSATSAGGRAGEFTITGATNGSAALYARTAGPGPALQALSTGAGIGNGPAITATHSGTGSEAGKFAITNASNSRAALYAQTTGTGAAGFFQGTTRGVLIVTNAGGTGLQVLNGTKQAVVPTPSGARSLYAEEATEVWFADYGFARLADGCARVALDSAFAQTVSLEEPYHVFVQTYGDAELVVRDRTPAGFRVVLRAGDERDAEFSYRVVARRRGFERTRLEPAPWADAVRAASPAGRAAPGARW